MKFPEFSHKTSKPNAVDPAARARNVVAIDRLELSQTPDECLYDTGFPQEFQYDHPANQDSDYRQGNKAAPNNNLFFEERSNPLSSKGN